MSSLILSGETSGTVTLQAATVSGNTVITLPSSTGTLLSSGVNTYNAVQTFTADNVFSGNNAFSGITTFTNTVVGITKTMVGLTNIDNTSDTAKPISSLTQAALDLKAPQSTTYNKTETDSRIQAIVGAAPLALDTLVEIAAQLASDESAAATLVTTVSGKVDKVAGKGLSTEDYTTVEKAKLVAITGTNTGDQIIPTTLPASDVYAWAKEPTKPSYTPTEISLGNVANTSDVNKPISTATQTALNLKATLNGINAFTLHNTFNTLSFVAIDKGNSGVSTQTFNYSAGGHQKLTITGATTIAFSNFPAPGRGELLVELVNGAAFTITWPSINFMKPDGTFTTSIATYLAANTGRTALKASGTDFLLLFSQDAGTTIYGKLL